MCEPRKPQPPVTRTEPRGARDWLGDVEDMVGGYGEVLGLCGEEML